MTKYCEQEKTEITEKLDLFIKVCHAIQHAHQKGIIHRDIKPSNILVTLHDGGVTLSGKFLSPFPGAGLPMGCKEGA